MNISVVIPAFNEEKRIAACLNSLKNQSKRPFEIIVIDNNSTDKTAEIALKLGAKVIKEKHQGVTFARNRGFNEAKGEIIARTDADTIVPSDWLERIDAHFENDSKLEAISGPAAFGLSFFTPIVKLIVFDTNKRIFGNYGLYGPNLALRKKAWERIKNEVCLDDDKVHEDTDLSIHLGRVGKVGFDKNMKVKTSARRLRTSPRSQLIEYIVKWADMIAYHKQYRVTKIASNLKQRIRY